MRKISIDEARTKMEHIAQKLYILAIQCNRANLPVFDKLERHSDEITAEIDWLGEWERGG